MLAARDRREAAALAHGDDASIVLTAEARIALTAQSWCSADDKERSFLAVCWNDWAWLFIFARLRVFSE